MFFKRNKMRKDSLLILYGYIPCLLGSGGAFYSLHLLDQKTRLPIDIHHRVHRHMLHVSRGAPSLATPHPPTNLQLQVLELAHRTDRSVTVFWTCQSKCENE